MHAASLRQMRINSKPAGSSSVDTAAGQLTFFELTDCDEGALTPKTKIAGSRANRRNLQKLDISMDPADKESKSWQVLTSAKKRSTARTANRRVMDWILRAWRKPNQVTTGSTANRQNGSPDAVSMSLSLSHGKDRSLCWNSPAIAIRKAAIQARFPFDER